MNNSAQTQVANGGSMHLCPLHGSEFSGIDTRGVHLLCVTRFYSFARSSCTVHRRQKSRTRWTKKKNGDFLLHVVTFTQPQKLTAKLTVICSHLSRPVLNRLPVPGKDDNIMRNNQEAIVALAADFSPASYLESTSTPRMKRIAHGSRLVHDLNTRLGHHRTTLSCP